MTDQIVTAADSLEAIIDDAFERRSEISPLNVGPILSGALDQIISELNEGGLRVAEKTDQGWVTHQWIKKAVLLYFRTHDNRVVPGSGGDAWFDKVPLRFNGYTEAQFREGGFRVVPPATVRTGAFIGRNVVLMPSYVNIGAYVDEGTMVDTWATVGSCAQIGKNVHLSGGAGIGGVLEPPNAVPVVIGDGALIGSRAMIVEGARVGEGAVVGAGTILSGSIPVIDVQTGEELARGHIPDWCVAVGGTRQKEFPGGTFGLPCVLVLKRLEPGQRHDKAALNDVLREHGVNT
jgi:2,3,4,5-tetrahydropyridine-2-carboxylate N-succinyltransferase